MYMLLIIVLKEYGTMFCNNTSVYYYLYCEVISVLLIHMNATNTLIVYNIILLLVIYLV